MSQNAVLLRCVRKRHQNGVAVHHGEEGVGCVTEVAEKGSVVPEDGHGEQNVPNEDWGDSGHDLDVHGDSHDEGARDDAVGARHGEVPGHCNPVHAAAKPDQRLNELLLEVGGQNVEEGTENGE